MGIVLAAVDEPAQFWHECPYALPVSGAVQGAISYAGSFMMPEWYLTAGRDQAESAMVQVFGMAREEAQQLLQTMLDTPFERWLEIAGVSEKGARFLRQLLPAWIDGSEPPILLIHGGDDNTVNPLESEAFAASLESKGVAVQLVIVPNANHGLGPSFSGYDETWNATLAFLAQLFQQYQPG